MARRAWLWVCTSMQGSKVPCSLTECSIIMILTHFALVSEEDGEEDSLDDKEEEKQPVKKSRMGKSKAAEKQAGKAEPAKSRRGKR